MSIYTEIPCNKIKIIDRDNDGKLIPEKQYDVHLFGRNGIVYDVELWERPTEKTTKAFDLNGVEIPELAKTEPVLIPQEG